jgi:hypothetical protein
VLPVRWTLLLIDGPRERFERAALRWHGRLPREVAGVGSLGAQAVLALFGLLAKPERATGAAGSLAGLLDDSRGATRRGRSGTGSHRSAAERTAVRISAKFGRFRSGVLAGDGAGQVPSVLRRARSASRPKLHWAAVRGWLILREMPKR